MLPPHSPSSLTCQNPLRSVRAALVVCCLRAPSLVLDDSHPADTLQALGHPRPPDTSSDSPARCPGIALSPSVCACRRAGDSTRRECQGACPHARPCSYLLRGATVALSGFTSRSSGSRWPFATGRCVGSLSARTLLAVFSSPALLFAALRPRQAP